jgi:hypothetical protein
MKAVEIDPVRIRSAWEGRVSGCQLGKPVEVLSMARGRKAIGEAVAAGWDTDCNGATVGGLFGLTGAPIPRAWTSPWAGRVGLGLAGHSELGLDELVDRTVAVARALR